MDALYTGPRKHGGFSTDFDRQPAMHTAAVAGIFAFRVFPNDDPVDLFTVVQRAFHAGQDPCRTHIRILVEALRNRQTQAPERHMIGNLLAADRTEKNRIEGLEPFEPALGNVVAMLQVIIGTPGKMLD